MRSAGKPGFPYKGAITMAGDKKSSKTNVAARAEAKAAQQMCKKCGNKVDVVMTLTMSGRKQMVRRCCGATV